MISEPIAAGTEIVLDTSLDSAFARAIVKREISPSAIMSVPPRSFNNLVSGPRMGPACRRVRVLTAVVGLNIPDVFNHHVAVEFFDVARMVPARAAAIQGGSDKEAFSFRVCESHVGGK